jgi:hypothetical protein
MRKLATKMSLAVAVAVLAVLGGCSPLDFLNQEFVASMVGGTAVSLPGNAPALLVGLENRTDRLANMTVMYHSAEGTNEIYTSTVQAGQSTAQALMCPVSQITLGDLSNPDVVGVTILLGNGTTSDPYIEVEPFGIPLKEGENYNCGDGITFTVQMSGATKSGYQTVAYIRRAGE